MFPASYDQAIRQAQESVKAALADGKTLIEVRADACRNAHLLFTTRLSGSHNETQCCPCVAPVRLQVEFPALTLSAVSGDGEGMNEMNLSMQYLRTFLGQFRDNAPGIRVFW